MTGCRDEKSDLLADSHNGLNRWKNYFPQLSNLLSISHVRQIDIHTAEALEPDPSPALHSMNRVTCSAFSLSLCTTQFKRFDPLEPSFQVGVV
jgi:hypothetical protein